MNPILYVNNPLPSVLDQASPIGPGRRHRIDNFELSTTKIDRFNAFLVQLGRQQPALDCDRLATAARQLRDRGPRASPSNGIARELRRGVAITRMISDASWEPANDAVSVAHQVVGYVRGEDDLIPDSLPKVGRLDDAIVIETAWPRLVAEIACYLDFRRIRRLEAVLRGMAEQAFGFTRRDWQEARVAEYELAVHHRSVRGSSYVPRSSTRFHVH